MNVTHRGNRIGMENAVKTRIPSPSTVYPPAISKQSIPTPHHTKPLPQQHSTVLFGNGDFYDNDLLKAIRTQDKETINKILADPAANGINLNAATRHGDTPLSAAVDKKDVDLVKRLIAAGANVNINGRNAESVLIKAVQRGTPEMLNVLLEAGANVNAVSEYGQTPLRAAAARTQFDLGLEFARALLAKGADVNKRKPGNNTPLMDAATYANARMVRLLLENGADLTLTDALNQTALLDGCRSGNPQVVKLLLERGADPNLISSNGATPLAVAAQGGFTQVVMMLLKKGADVNLPEEPRTLDQAPLAAAISSDRNEIVDLILNHPQFNRENKKLINNCVFLSAASNNLDALRKMLALGGNVNFALEIYSRMTPLMTAVSQVNTGLVVDELLKHGANVNTRDADGAAPLHYVLNRDYFREMPDYVDKLLEKGAKINQPDARGLTPLHLAVETGIPEMVEHLLSKGADANSTTAEEKLTPLMQAAFEGKSKILALLLRNGAKLEEKNRDGETALTLLMIQKQLSIQLNGPFTPEQSKEYEQCQALLKAAGAVEDPEKIKRSVDRHVRRAYGTGYYF